jgi:hypothetical protein
VLVRRCLQQMPAIFSYLAAQGILCLLAFWEALQFKAMHIPIKPVEADDPEQPVRSYFCDLVEGCSQALSHTFQTA